MILFRETGKRQEVLAKIFTICDFSLNISYPAFSLGLRYEIDRSRLGSWFMGLIFRLQAFYKNIVREYSNLT